MTESNLQHNQELRLHENERSITAANQNSSIARIVHIVYFLFGALELLLAVRVANSTISELNKLPLWRNENNFAPSAHCFLHDLGIGYASLNSFVH